MGSDFVPLDSLFFSKVVQRNLKPDGSVKDPRLLARMQNPICLKCQADYRKKYPDQPFSIRCDGIYDDTDFQLMKEQYEEDNLGDTLEVDDIREIFDVPYWAEKNCVVKDDNQDLQPFKARWYQEEIMRCTAQRKVDRCGRGLGKTSVGVIEELHKAVTTKNYEILVVSPGDAQSEKWFNELKFQFDNSPTLGSALAGQKQQPFKIFRFHNGSTISLFTAGSKSGRGADSVRSQSPRRVRLEEQDLLAEKDYDAILPLTRRYKNSEVHGTSTPTGLRSMYWRMCTQSPDYREFYFPIQVHPDWGTEQLNEQTCLREVKTMERYQHEYLAEFGDPSAGVFKSMFIDQAKKQTYEDGDQPYLYRNLHKIAGRHYFMGVDWNGAGTGTKIRVVEYDPDSHKRRVVDKRSVDEPGSTMRKSMEAIRDMNRKWLCTDIFVDYGFGNGQDEMIRAMGVSGEHPADARLKNVRVIDFGATLEFNKLVTGRAFSKYIDKDENKFERRTKPFMVDGAVMALEAGLLEFSGVEGEDPVLEEQMRAYRVKKYSNHGYPSVYEAVGVGDHDLDALMLAMLACEMKFGLFQSEASIKRLAQIIHLDGWGIPKTSAASDSLFRDPQDLRREAAGVPRRSMPATSDREKWRLAYLMRGGAYVAPVSNVNQGSGRWSRTAPPSRTTVFRNKPKRGPF